jgi:probable HAF family extracellular repeat protein
MKLLTTSLLAAATLCQAQSLTDLGTLTGSGYSFASGVSANGNVVVGYSNSTNGDRAFRWTNNVMTDLGTLTGGGNSWASGVSANGNVVVGYSNSTNGTRAFRWTNNVMTDLGTLTGSGYSEASGVSADGNVVVGISTSTNGARAFRWTNNVMTDLGTLTGGSSSQAKGVSADGNVVVGNSVNANGDTRAFRWTNNVMTDLGTLTGSGNSYANGVSADGNVVVGFSNSTNGDRAFLYRNSVMLDVQDWLGSVGGVCSMLSTSLDLSRAHLEGAHHRPLAELGRGRSYWTTGDVASSSRSRDLITRSGEAGVTFEPWTNVLVGVGAGYGRQDQQLLNDGSASTFGQYLIGEVDLIQADGGIFSVIVSVGDWKNETDRGYVTGAGVDFSHGETSLASKAFRLRYDSPVLVKTLGTDVKAYVSYGHSKVRSDAYVETGGSNAGSFGAMEQTAKEGRLGVAATRSFGEKFRGRLSAEWIRRFDRDQASITATDLTSTLDLTLPGTAVVRDQARFGFDLDYLMDAKTTLSFTVHAAGRGESADVSGAISLRKAF